MSSPAPDGEHLMLAGVGEPARLRRATRADLALIARLLLELSDRSRYLRYQIPWHMSDEAARREAERMLDGSGGRLALLVLVRRDGEDHAVAVGELAPAGDRIAELALLVRDDLQQRGIGAWLGRALLASARTLGLRSIRVDVLVENRGARTLMRRLGFDRQLAAAYGAVRLEASVDS